FKVLLQYYTQRDDLVVGVDFVNRSRPEVEEVIGMFVNQLVLRTDLSGNPSFRELLRRVSKVAIQAYAHHDLPLDKLVDILKPQRSLSRNPLFQVMFGLQNIPKPILELPDLVLEYWKLETRTAVFDLSLYMSETQQGLVGLLRYNTDLFEPAV